jgi:hypothetical protein
MAQRRHPSFSPASPAYPCTRCPLLPSCAQLPHGSPYGILPLVSWSPDAIASPPIFYSLSHHSYLLSCCPTLHPCRCCFCLHLAPSSWPPRSRHPLQTLEYLCHPLPSGQCCLTLPCLSTWDPDSITLPLFHIPHRSPL